MNGKRVLWLLLLVSLIGGSLWGLQRLLVPKYMGEVIEGAFIGEYYQETSGHDVIFLGDCEVYENISPVKLWKEYGLTSYIRGSAQQMVSQSYYLLEDTLRYEIPKVVVMSVSAMVFEKQEKEAYNRMTMDGMRWSLSKGKAIRASMMEEEHMVDYVISLLRYHSRWQELTGEDFEYYFHRDKVSHNGYYMRNDVRPAGTFPKERRLSNYQFSDTSYEYLDQIRVLCEAEGIQLVLMKAPSLYPTWHDQWNAQIAEYAKQHGLLYINTLEVIAEIGLDFNTDTYDAGLHLNLPGAEKLSIYLGKVLKETCGLPDRREDRELSGIWDEKTEFYETMKEEQLKEWRK